MVNHESWCNALIVGKYPLEMLMDNFDNQFKFNAIDIGRILCIR